MRDEEFNSNMTATIHGTELDVKFGYLGQFWKFFLDIEFVVWGQYERVFFTEDLVAFDMNLPVHAEDAGVDGSIV
jgi:hypothetical protein